MEDHRKHGLIKTAAFVLAAMLPVVALSTVDWKQVSGVASLAAMTCFVAAAMGTLRLGLILTMPLAIASSLAFTCAHSPWLAAILLAVATAAWALTAQWGYNGPLSLAPISVAFIVAEPPTPDSSIPDALFVGLVILAAGLYAVLIVYLMDKVLPPAQQAPPLEKNRARGYAVAVGLLVGVATWFVVDLGLGHPGAWIDLTLIVVFQPYVKDGLTKSLSRGAGTVLGFLVAIAVGALVRSPGLISLCGTIALIVAFDLMSKRKPYWQYACGITVAIVLLSGANSSVEELAYDRLGATLVGVVIALVAVMLLEPLSKWYSERVGDAKF